MLYVLLMYMENIAGWMPKKYEDLENNVTNEEYHYNSEVYSFRSGGELQLKPPQTIYTSYVFFPLLFKPDFYKKTNDGLQNLISRRAMSGIISNTIGVLLTLFSQITCIFYLNKDVLLHHTKSSCDEGSNILRLICLGMFIANIGSEIIQSFDLRRYIQQIPEWDEKDRDICTLLETCLVCQQKIIKTHHGVEYSITHISKGGVTKCYRAFMYSSFVTKVCIELCLLMVVSSYVFYSKTNANMILKALSLKIFVNIDNFMYSFLISNTYKNTLETGIPALSLIMGTPEKSFSISDNCMDNLWQEHASIYILGLCSLTMVISYHWWCIL